MWWCLSLLLTPSTFAFELWVGARDLRPTSNVVLWLNGSSWADGISVGYPPLYNSSDLASLSAEGLRLLPCIHSCLETMQRQLFDDPPAVPDTAAFASAYTATLPDFKAASAAGPQPFMWWSLTEDDSSGVGFPYAQLAVPPSSHADAYAQFDAYLQRAQVVSLYLSPGTPLAAQVGFAEQVHAHFARGVSLALIERANDDIGDLDTALAFARGAARQYNASFGIDLSWWWGVLYSGVNRLPGSYHRRHAYASLFGGASVVNIEGGDGLCDSGGAPLALGAELQAFASFARTLFPRQPAQRQGLGPTPQPLTPVLLVIPKDHGYATKPYWLTQQQGYGYLRLPPRQGDAALQGFFQLLFPGAGYAQDPFPFGAFAVDDPPASMWALSSLTAPYAPRAADAYAAAPYLPYGTYHNRTEAAQDFAAQPRDPATARPMGDSTWGGLVDVAVAGLGLASASARGGAGTNVWGAGRRQQHKQGHPRSSSAAAEEPLLPLGGGPAASGYRLCIVLGPVNLTLALKAQLLAFAQAGGQVVVAAGVVGPGDADLTGIPTLLPELRVGRAWRYTAGGAGAGVQLEPFRYLPSRGASSSSANLTVLASTVAPVAACGGVPCPLAVRWAVGEGAVTTLLLPWMEGEQGLSLLARGLLGAALDGLAPLALSWEPGQGWPVSFSASTSPDRARLYALVSNNEEAEWRGEVTVTAAAGAPSALGQCRELRTGQPLPLGGAAGRTVQLTVPAMDVAVVSCQATWP
jgi:hypothetical protein